MHDERTFDLADHAFLIEVRDDATGESRTTLNPELTPAILLSYAANRFTTAASNYFKQNFTLGSVDWRMVFLLAAQPGSTVIHASKTIGIDKGAISRCLQRLEEVGLASAGPVHANGRSRGWHLTREGGELHDEMLQIALDRQRALLKGFEPDEVTVFCCLLQRFLVNLAGMPD